MVIWMFVLVLLTFYTWQVEVRNIIILISWITNGFVVYVFEEKDNNPYLTSSKGLYILY